MALRIKQMFSKKVICAVLMTTAGAVMASDLTLGGMASSITSSFESVTKLITAGAYLGGLAFMIGAVMKFKQHKDNPTNITIGTPLALTFIGGSLLFLPSLLGVTGATLFSGSGTTAGPSGSVFSS